MSQSESQNRGEDNAATSGAARASGGWRRFGLRELFLLVLAAALAVGWYSSSRRSGGVLSRQTETVRRIEGPLIVDYSVQRNENTVENNNNMAAAALDFHEQYIILTTAGGSARLIPVSSLRSFRWRPAPQSGGAAPATTTHRSH